MSSNCAEVVWLRSLLDQLRFSQPTSTPFHADNTNVIHIVANLVFHERT